jgi:CRISPR-associated exonuclease Cas4
MDGRISGVMFYYYFICKRKLWYFSHNIQMESFNDDVIVGKHIDETTYNRKKKHIMIDEIINIDFIDDYKVIHEIKKARSIEEAAIWQLKYYIWYLNKKGIEGLTGVLDYPKLKQKIEIELEAGDDERITNALQDIDEIIENSNIPKVLNEKICKKCAYYELCYI